ncbi:hypothetical protein AGMMS50239_22700 [Bacteroidia bacterium]|nr:hypothetical protein AGMMS50239_22700 [Bacteroidia bacterium]
MKTNFLFNFKKTFLLLILVTGIGWSPSAFADYFDQIVEKSTVTYDADNGRFEIKFVYYFNPDKSPNDVSLKSGSRIDAIHGSTYTTLMNLVGKENDGSLNYSGCPPNQIKVNSFFVTGGIVSGENKDNVPQYMTFYYYPPSTLLGKKIDIQFNFIIEQNNDSKNPVASSWTDTGATLPDLNIDNFNFTSGFLSSSVNKMFVKATSSGTLPKGAIKWNGSAYTSGNTYTLDRLASASTQTQTITWVFNEKVTKTITKDITVKGYQAIDKLTADYDPSGKVNLVWRLEPGSGDRYGGDYFNIQYADNLSFNDPKSLTTTVAVEINQTEDFSYVHDLVTAGLSKSPLYYRITRSASQNDWGWDFGKNTYIDYTLNHVGITSASATLEEPDKYAIIVNWEHNSLDYIWSPGSEFVIIKNNLTAGTTQEIKLTQNDIATKEYRDPAIQICNTYQYDVFVRPGKNTYQTARQSTEKITPTRLGSLNNVTASKGYFSDRVELDWNSNGSFDQFAIERKENGASANEWKTIQTVAGNSVLTSYKANDVTGSAGIVYDYRITGLLNCSESIIYSNKVEDVGFRTPTGDIYGRVTFENGQAVEGVEVSVETEVAIESKSLAFTAGAVATVNDTSFLKNNTDSVTLQAWIAPAATAGLQKVISKDGMYELGISDNLFYFKAGGETLATDTFSVTAAQVAGEFIHLTGVYDSRRLLIYINGKLIAETDSSPVITGNDNPITFGGGDFEGILDEVRIWSIPLTAADIKRDYTRYLTGEEKNLIAYHTFNYATDSAFYDISYQSTEYNGNHGKLSAGVSLSSHYPTNSQLGNKGVTGADGSYAVRAIPYKGNSTAYQIIPRMGAGMGIHRFEPEREVRSISPTSQNHTVNFIDKSSFRVTGFVTYANSTIPVEGVSFAIDGKTALKSNGIPEESDADGKFTIDVPVGTHEVKAGKVNHTFVNDGRITDQYLQDLNYQDEVSGVELKDNTTIKYIGRVAGGTIQEAFPVGHSISTNNLADDITVTLTHTKTPTLFFDSDTVTETHFKPSNQTKVHTNTVEYTENKVVIHVNDTTGEFVAHLIPEQFTVNINAGKHIDIPGSGSTVNLTQQFILQNEVYQYTDSVQLDPNNWKKTNYSDTVKYQMKQKFIKRYTPQVRITQTNASGNSLPHFGTDTTRITNLIGETEVIPLYNGTANTYTFDQPVFIQHQNYPLKMEIFEQYIHYNQSGEAGAIDEVATQDAKVKFNNDLAVTESKATEVAADEKGVAYYTFQAGDPDLTSGFKYLNASITYGKDDNPATIPWTQPASFKDGKAFLLGSHLLGTDFVTAGPDKVLTVLRDPPGSSSYSYLEKGITFNESSTYTGSIENEGSEEFTFGVEQAVITFTGIGAGNINTLAEAESGATLGVVHSEQYQGQDTKTTTTTTTTRFQTGDSEDYVGPDGDVYIGYSTNVTVGATENVSIISKAKYDASAGYYKTAYAVGNDWVIIKNSGLSTSQSFKTLFAYPQMHIENRLIPELRRIRNSVLLLPSEYTEAQLKAAVAGTDKVFYLSQVNADHADFGKTNPNGFDGPYYKIIYDDTQINLRDTIENLNQSISAWEKRMAVNEEQKTEAVLLQNYSFHGGSPIEYSESYASGLAHESTFYITVGIKGGNDWELGAGLVKTKFKLEEQATTTHGGTFSSDVERSHSKGFVLADNGNDYISVDVCREKDWKEGNEGYGGSGNGGMVNPGDLKEKDYYSSFIFKTKGGATSCPYEGEYLTKYFEPGVHKINEATLHVEAPGIDMPVKFIENVPSGESAKPYLWLRNNSEVREPIWYNLKINNASNPDGATFHIDGAAIGNGLEFLVPAGETLVKTLEISRGKVLNYDDLQLILQSQCQEDIVDTVTFSVHFIPSCTNVSIKKPSNKWIYNTKLPTMKVNGMDKHYMEVLIDQFNVNYDNFNRIELQYKSASQSDNEWTTLMSYYNDTTLYNAALDNGLNAEMILASYAGTIPYRFVMDDMQDQYYDLRAVSVCVINNEEVRNESEVRSGLKDTYLPRLFGSPQPANGILTINDDIRLNFNELIAEGLLTRHNFQVQGVRNGSVSDHSVSVDFDGTSDYLETEFEKSLEGKDFTIELWIQTDRDQNATLFSHGNANESLEVLLTADRHLKVNIGTSEYTSQDAVAFDAGSWAHVAVVYEASGYLTAYYNYYPVIDRTRANAYNASGNIVLGKSIRGNSNPFRGKMHNVLVWEKALDRSEIQLNSLTQLSGLEAGLMAYYPMNEGKGSFAQDKARGATLLMNGCKWALPDGYAVLTNGSSEYLKLSSASSAILKDMDFTIEFWFKGAPGQKNATLFSNGRGDGQQENGSDYLFNIGFDENGKLAFTNNSVKTVATGDYLDNNWHHFAIGVSRAIGRAQIYMDGKLNTFVDASAVGGISSPDMFIGARGWYDANDAANLKVDNYFNGQFDDLRFWELYKNESLVSENNNVKLTGTELGLIHYYPFDKYIEFQGNQFLEFSDKDMRIASGPNPEIDSLIVVGSTSSLVQTKDIAPLKDATKVENLEFDWVTNSDALIINLLEPEYKVAKTIVTFTVTDVRDVNGNSIASPITWSAYIDKNQLKWNEDRLNLAKKVYEPLEFTLRAVNSGGSIQHYTIHNAPAWLDVTPSSGIVNPSSYSEIQFTVNEGLNIGSYNEVIYLTNEANVSEALTLNLTVTGEKPDWTVNPANFKYNMSVFGKMRFNNIFSADKEDMLAAFSSSGECIGVAHGSYNKELDMWYALLTVYNNERNTDNLEFRMWDASTGKTYKATPDTQIHFTNDAIYGTAKQPVIFDGKEIFYQNIALNSGWNWISFNLANNDLSDVNKTLSTGKWSGNDIAKVLETFDSYSTSQKKWMGTLSQNGGFNNTSMFLINSEKAQTFSASGSAIDTKTVPITIKGNHQWNYISYLPAVNTTVNEALAGYDAHDGDVVKSLNSFAMYSQNRWTGNLTYMEANKGYMLRRLANNDVTFIYPSVSGAFGNLRSSEVPVNNPADDKYSNYRFAENMNVIATSMDLQEGDQIKAYINGDLRGIGEYTSNGEIPLSFITIAGNETNGAIHFELQRAGETIGTANAQFNYTPNTVSGTTEIPVILDFSANAGKASVYPNPFQTDFKIEIKVEKDEQIDVKVVDIAGRTVLLQNKKALFSGTNTVVVNGSALTNGVYVVKVTAGNSSGSYIVVKVK